MNGFTMCQFGIHFYRRYKVSGDHISFNFFCAEVVKISKKEKDTNKSFKI